MSNLFIRHFGSFQVVCQSKDKLPHSFTTIYQNAISNHLATSSLGSWLLLQLQTLMLKVSIEKVKSCPDCWIVGLRNSLGVLQLTLPAEKMTSNGHSVGALADHCQMGDRLFHRLTVFARPTTCINLYKNLDWIFSAKQKHFISVLINKVTMKNGVKFYKPWRKPQLFSTDKYCFVCFVQHGDDTSKYQNVHKRYRDHSSFFSVWCCSLPK